MIAREDLHELIDSLAEGELPDVRRYLRYLTLVARDKVSPSTAGEQTKESRPSTGSGEGTSSRKAPDA